MPATLQGVVINEILPDPSGSSNFDSDGDGNFESNDEFVELYNTNGTPVDISGWTLGEGDGTDPDFTFPPGTVIPAGGHVVVIGGWDSMDPLPANWFDIGNAPSTGIFNNGGEEILLSDGTDTIAAVYNAEDPGDVPMGAAVDDFGTDAEGESIQRVPGGADTFVVGTPTPGATNLCFGRGTMIATPNGERAVEDLKIGDLILSGDGRAIAVKWVGFQTVVPAFGVAERMEPVRIAAGALGDGLPMRDLTVTADHGMILDGLVVNASALVNGHSIRFVPTEGPRATYYHIETEGHEVILANGAQAETFVDVISRRAFDNFAEYERLYGAEDVVPAMDMPRISAQRLLPMSLKVRLGIAPIRQAV